MILFLGGDPEIAKSVNVAYDVLSGKSALAGPQSQRGSSAWSGDDDYSPHNTYSGRSSGYQERGETGSRGTGQRGADTPEWAWAGYSGSLPPCDLSCNNFSIALSTTASTGLTEGCRSLNTEAPSARDKILIILDADGYSGFRIVVAWIAVLIEQTESQIE